MINASVESVSELRKIVSRLPNGLLYRGQTGHYLSPEGGVSMPSSQLRKGCVPSELRKWSFYAREAITAFSGGEGPGLELVQALLQHYGWRSFYVDLSANVHVGCWFAGHSYSEEVVLEMGEDYEERPVLLRHRSATYRPHAEAGHLYAVDPARASKGDARCIDLRSELGTDFSARYEKQAGWLVGPLADPLEPECVVAHVSGPGLVFQELAREGGLCETADLFPAASQDAFLEMFESVPWKRLGLGEPPAFARDLELPDYHCTPRGRYGPNVAFPLMREMPHEGPITYLVPNEMFFAGPDGPAHDLSAAAALVRKHRFVRVETEDLIRLPEHFRSDLYCKGFYMEWVGEQVQVGAIMAEHPGLDLAVGAGDAGWFYSLSASGSFTRISHAKECPCDKPHRHEQLLSAVIAFDWLLRNGTVNQVSPVLIDMTAN